MDTTTPPAVRRIHRALAAGLLMAFVIPGLANDRASDPPQVGDSYQDRINTAWDEAGSGTNPSMTCAAVKGRAAGTGDPDAFRALFACNVDIPARYFHTYLDTVAAGEKSCLDLMREVMTKLSAMTMSADVVVEMAEQLEAGDGAESAVRDALGAAAEDAMTEDGLADPKRLVKDRISARTRELCPDLADTILR